MSILSTWNKDRVLFLLTETDVFELPLYSEVKDDSWSLPDLPAIIEYLKNGRVTNAVPLFKSIVCPLCHTALEHATSRQQTDGKWVWFCTLAHYVQFHQVRLPDRMVEYIRANAYAIPAPAMGQPLPNHEQGESEND